MFININESKWYFALEHNRQTVATPIDASITTERNAHYNPLYDPRFHFTIAKKWKETIQFNSPTTFWLWSPSSL